MARKSCPVGFVPFGKKNTCVRREEVEIETPFAISYSPEEKNVLVFTENNVVRGYKIQTMRNINGKTTVVNERHLTYQQAKRLYELSGNYKTFIKPEKMAVIFAPRPSNFKRGDKIIHGDTTFEVQDTFYDEKSDDFIYVTNSTTSRGGLTHQIRDSELRG